MNDKIDRSAKIIGRAVARPIFGHAPLRHYDIVAIRSDFTYLTNRRRNGRPLILHCFQVIRYKSLPR